MNPLYISYSDDELLILIVSHDDQEAFAELYDRYFRILFNFAYSKIDHQEHTQDLIQELFVSLWHQRQQLRIESCRPYLFGMLKNLILGYYRKEHTRLRHYEQWGAVQQTISSEASDQEALTTDLRIRYEKGLNLLPSRCKEVYLLSRNGFTNREIAKQLAISDKTVEHHITKALRILKHYLSEHLPYFLLLTLRIFPF